MTTNYALSGLNFTWLHGVTTAAAVQDIDEIDERHIVTDIQVASGDYFATLATNLDRIAVNLAAQHDADAPELQDIVEDLLYLQQHYKIAKKR